MTQIIRLISILVCLFALFPLSALAQYKDYIRKETKKRLYEISFDKSRVTLTPSDGKDSTIISADRGKITISDSEVRLNAEAAFSPGGLTIHNHVIPFERISDIEISYEGELTRIAFYEISVTSPNLKKTREGNIITFSEAINVERESFVRGLVFSVKGPITVYGEVNKDIVSLFGNITLLTGSISRGNIASITGTITVEEKATVYGEIYSGIREFDSRRFRFYHDNEFEAGLMLDYNRVDGLTAGVTAGYFDGDSSLPSVEVGVGYAMESKRPRHYARASQLISRKKSVLIGAEYYRRLASEDDWLLGNPENAVFALLVTEDFKDYYESEGFTGWISLDPNDCLELKSGYRFDDTRWLGARTHLWSLFGGNKLFRDNYSSVDESYRAVGQAELDSTAIGSLFLEAIFETRDFEAEYDRSGWALTGELEWSNQDIGSGFDFRKYSLTA
ncbi:MAG: hypothetical protein ACREBV_06290, partial [Candidatus Zixiibacteriota bacterium]